jgi:NADH-quinone oxidoreductase subunit L
MTGVLVLLAALSAVGGFIAIPHFLEPMLPLPAVVPALHHYETPLVVVAVAIGLAGLAFAAYCFGGDGARGARIADRFDGIRRVLAGKYFVDELYDRVITQPLLWISDRVFLKASDRALIDGSLHGLAGLARRAAGGFGRIQTGSLHLYAFLVLAGLIGALAWSWRHG